ncbi:NAD(P)H-dependent oxidoreductase subunit E [candidate division GN15 bacterium]|nr:NAD(P)H-dependent oxidoreductase subunit E [candidate division GN15 bacterium]
MKHDLAKIPEIIGRYPQQESSLIMVLQDIQKEFNYLPCEALEQTAEALHVPLSKVFSVSTFYNAFSLTKKGDVVVRVCIGTACHIRGARQIQEQLETALKIQAGETTRDEKFTLEVVGCVGACAMAPVVLTNEQYHAQCKVHTVKKLVSKR